MDDLKKPLPVVIVEAIAWMYVMLSALLFVCAIVNACRDGGESLSGILFVFLYGLCLMSVPVGMAILLRRGRRMGRAEGHPLRHPRRPLRLYAVPMQYEEKR